MICHTVQNDYRVVRKTIIIHSFFIKLFCCCWEFAGGGDQS